MVPPGLVCPAICYLLPIVTAPCPWRPPRVGPRWSCHCPAGAESQIPAEKGVSSSSKTGWWCNNHGFKHPKMVVYYGLLWLDLVGGAMCPSWTIWVRQWEGLAHIWNGKYKPPTRYFNQHKQWQMGTEPWTTAISGDWMATIYGVLAGGFSGENLMISLISWPWAATSFRSAG